MRRGTILKHFRARDVTLSLPHSSGISYPLEAKPRKGKVSLIYWTSTASCTAYLTVATLENYASAILMFATIFPSIETSDISLT
jgi:hypothetical protein